MDIKHNFPTAEETERMGTLDKYNKLYNNEQQGVLLLHEFIRKQYRNVADIVYLGHAIPAKVSDFYGDFVQGDVDAMTLDSVEDADRETVESIRDDNDVEERIHDWGTKQSISGYTVLLGYVDTINEETKFLVQDIRADQYFPQRDGSVIFATYFRDYLNVNAAVEEEEAALLLYTQKYEMNGQNCQIIRQVWATDAEGKAADDLGEETLNAYFGDVPAQETIDKIGRLPIVQIDNGMRTNYGFGKSDYVDIMPQLGEVNERRTHIATQLLKNLSAKLELPEREDLKDEFGGLKEFDYIMRADKDEPETRFVINENPLIEATEVHIESQLKMIANITDVPMWQLIENSEPETVGGMKIKLFAAIRKTTRKRAKMKKGIQTMFEIGFLMLGKEMEGKLLLEFSDVLPNDELVDSQVEEIKVRTGISSKRSAMRRVENMTDDELDAEEEQMKKESIESGAVDPNEPPEV